MRFLSPPLPPLAILLLLAFVWTVLLVLVLWFMLPRGERPAETEKPDRARRADRRVAEHPRRAVPDDADGPRPTHSRVLEVRVEAGGERPDTPDTGDAFDDFERSGRRRDDLDF